MSRNAYPVAGYRTSAARAYNPGFQTGSRVSEQLVGRAANDNAARAVESLVARTALKGFAHAAAYAVPVLDVALLAYDVYQLYRWYEGQDEVPGGPVPAPGAAAWYLAGSCPDTGQPDLPGLYVYQESSGHLSTSCPSPTLVIVGTPKAQDAAVNSNTKSVQLFARQESSSRGNMREIWWRDSIPAGQETVGPYVPSDPVPARAPQWQPSYAWSPVYAIDPMTMPIGQPIANPEPLPYRDLPSRGHNPYRVHQSEFGYDLPPEPELPETPTPPAIEIYPSPGGRPSPEHNFARPPKRTKERKFKLALNNGSVIGRIVGATGEAADFVNALWWALPKSVRTKGRPPLQQKALDVYRHFSELDMEQALKNLVVNEIQDRVIGRIGRAVAKVNARSDRPAGLMVGPAL